MVSNLIHLAYAHLPERGKTLLLLRKVKDREYRWYIEDKDGSEQPTEFHAETPQEAIQLGSRHWRLYAFKQLGCGFRYTLPERDEHGMNALFHQMRASLSSMTGIYFDEELGHNCFVQNASQEAIDLWHTLEKASRL